jgi:predicted alpha/beta superfamily hydrolase
MADWQDYRSVWPETEGHTVVGNLKFLDQLYSRQLDNRRSITVYLPPSYESSDKRYPVLYMHDGQNLFDVKTSYVGEWQVDETMERLSLEGIETIIVGIPNMGEQRMSEYSASKSMRFGAEGHGNRYLEFLCDTLKPLIDQDFRTLPDRKHTGTMGSSMGGLISLYGFFRHHETFGFAGIMSPAFYVNEKKIFTMVHDTSYIPGKLYIDVGTQEVPEQDDQYKKLGITSLRYLEGARGMRDLLIEKGYRLGSDLMYIEEENAIHHESAWARRLPHALRFLLAG